MGASDSPSPDEVQQQQQSSEDKLQKLKQLRLSYAWIGIWVVLSVSIILVNKHVIAHSGFRFPCSLALFHMLLATITSRTAIWLLGIPDTIREQHSPALYAQVAMTAVLFAGALYFGNAAFLHLSVPTIQMLKSSTPAVVYAVSILLRAERATMLQTAKVAIVCSGVAIAGYGDVSFSAVGIALQLVSISMDAVRCCTLQRVLQSAHIKVGPLVTLAHVAPFSAAAMLLPVVCFEGPNLVSDWPKWRAGVPMVLLSGLLASALNFAVFKVIGLTSALTSSLTGVFKDWACILIAMELYGTVVSPMQWTGYAVALAGLFWYHYGKFAAAKGQLPTIAAPPDSESAPLLHDKLKRESSGGLGGDREGLIGVHVDETSSSRGNSSGGRD